MVRHRFCREFNINIRDAPKDNIILRFVNHFEGKGSVHNTNKGNSGRQGVVTKTQAKIDAARNSAIESPKKSHTRIQRF